MLLVGGCGTWSNGEESGVVDGPESLKGGGGARLVGFGGGGSDDCGERGGRTNSVVTSSFGCAHEANRSSTLVIRAIVSLDGGGGEGGMSSVSNVCVGTAFLGGELNLTLFLPFFPATAIDDLLFCFAGGGFIGDFDFLREGEASFFFNTDLTSADDADVPETLGDGGRSSIIFLTSQARRSSRNSNRWTSSAALSLPSFSAASVRLRRSSSSSSRSACNRFFSPGTTSEPTSGIVERTRDESWPLMNLSTSDRA